MISSSKASTKVLTTSAVIRGFSTSSFICAKGAPPNKDGKKKVKQGFKVKKDPEQSKVRKGGMTHLTFKDAVRSLGFEKNAKKLNVDTLDYEKFGDQVGSVVQFSPETVTKLSGLGSFKKYQYHELFSNPVSLISKNLVDLNDKFVNKVENPTSKNRIILLGEYRSGKSVLMSQIKSLILSKYKQDVILLHLDHAEKIIEGSSDYIFNKKLNLYQQPMFTKRWIQKLRSANEDIFKKLPLTRDITFTTKKVEHTLKKDENTLYDLVEKNYDFGKFGPSNAFEFLIEEIKHHSSKIPVLVSIDNFNALTTNSPTKYRHPNFEPIHFKDFEVGNLILRLASGEFEFNKGGVLLSESNDIGKSKTLSVGLGLEPWDPYYKTDQCDGEVASKLLSNGGVQHHKVSNLNKQETTTLLEFYHANGVLQLRSYPTKKNDNEGKELSEAEAQNNFDTLVHNNYTLSSGNPGMLLKSVALNY